MFSAEQLVTNKQNTRIGEVKQMWGDTHALVVWEDSKDPVLESIDGLEDYTIPTVKEENTLPFEVSETVAPINEIVEVKGKFKSIPINNQNKNKKK